MVIVVASKILVVSGITDPDPMLIQNLIIQITTQSLCKDWEGVSTDQVGAFFKQTGITKTNKTTRKLVINLYTDKDTGRPKREAPACSIALPQLRRPVTGLLRKSSMATSLVCPLPPEDLNSRNKVEVEVGSKAMEEREAMEALGGDVETPKVGTGYTLIHHVQI